MSRYIECTFHFPDNQEFCEILMADLADLPFESFEDFGDKLIGYVRKECYSEADVQRVVDSFVASGYEITREVKEYEPQNWNEEWEKNFEPIIIDSDCIIRAPFHKVEGDFRFDLIIQPKMSFGTGHHETTRLMVKQSLEIGFFGLKVLDMGCGTSVLAILASKMGAENVLAIDNNEWAYDNSLENVVVNHVENTSVLLGDESLLTGKQFDVILANINRNIILEQLKVYASCLTNGGILVASGFYDHDEAVIVAKANEYGFSVVLKMTENNWVSIKFLYNGS
ncbi:MAG: 50S ribosomal protein L11 methyltransferase [Bacteroidetes bacterium]|nr:50S ribosomal protein L11 methyltransferase [Bacteroidota bacterium]MBU1720384.1 50S ribosomal protein L11 methyltransferase [Bacteroidota bacterium]